MLYWAYGSNLNVRAMRRRCPAAKKIGALCVTEAKLIFRDCADVTLHEGGFVPGGLWRITKDCEAELDRYEGVRSGFYLKRYIVVNMKRAGPQDCLFYQMRTKRGIRPPSDAYLDVIAEGYRDFGLDLAYLDAALQESWENKKMTDWLRERHVRKGKLERARPA